MTVGQPDDAARATSGLPSRIARCASSAARTATRFPRLTDVLQNRSADARRNAVWALTRIDGSGRPRSRSNRDRRRGRKRQACSHSRRRAVARSRCGGGLARRVEVRAPSIQRAAAEALGRIGDSAGVPDLSRSRRPARSGARALGHIRAHRDQRSAAIDRVRAAGASVALAARRADRPGSDGSPHAAGRTVVPLLDSSDSVLKDTAWWVAGHHPEWGDALAEFFTTHLARAPRTARRTAAEAGAVWRQRGDSG